MKIGIIGSGISGLSCAYFLNQKHEITVFESERNIGGHTATFDVQLGTEDYAVDTGFIVFNDRNYPNFLKLIEDLGIPTKKTSMGFSLSDPETGLEYSGKNLNTLFAQRRNILSWSFLTMAREILRFNKKAITDLQNSEIDPSETLITYLERNNYSKIFIDKCRFTYFWKSNKYNYFFCSFN